MDEFGDRACPARLHGGAWAGRGAAAEVASFCDEF